MQSRAGALAGARGHLGRSSCDTQRGGSRDGMQAECWGLGWDESPTSAWQHIPGVRVIARPQIGALAS
jgi:hypothetical protein